MELEELRSLYEDLNVTFKDDVTLKRAIIYYQFVKDVYDSFTTGNVKKELSKIANGYERVGRALTQADLLQGLCEILDEYIIAAVNTSLSQSNATYGVYFNSMLKNYPTSVETFLQDHIPPQKALTQLASSFENNILVACQRILNDWASLTTVFTGPNTVLEKLIDIQSTGSDFHKGGQQVLILTFKTYPTGRPLRIVYKPSDLEADCLLIGNSEAINRIYQPGFQDASLMEILNGLIEKNPIYGISFPTYKILPRNAGSRLQADQNGKLPVRDSYGYIEYLSNEDEKPGISPISSYTYGGSDFKIFPDQNTESICKRFYTLIGQLTAIAVVFSISDLHMQNMIVNNYLPYLIDLENTLVRQMTDLLDTELIGGPEGGGAIDGIAFKFEDALDKALNDESKAIAYKPRFTYEKNRLWRAPNSIISPAEFIGPICSAFEKTMQLINKCLQANQNPFADWFTRLRKGVIVRLVPLPTRRFHKCIRDAFTGNVDSKVSLKKVMQDELEKSYGDWKPTTQPLFLCLQQGYVLSDMVQLDIPVFYHRLNTLNVLDSSGNVLAVPQDLTIKGVQVNIQNLLQRSTFYSAPPLDHVANVQLLQLSNSQTLQARMVGWKSTLTIRVTQNAQSVKAYQSLVNSNR